MLVCTLVVHLGLAPSPYRLSSPHLPRSLASIRARHGILLPSTIMHDNDRRSKVLRPYQMKLYNRGVWVPGLQGFMTPTPQNKLAPPKLPAKT